MGGPKLMTNTTGMQVVGAGAGLQGGMSNYQYINKQVNNVKHVNNNQLTLNVRNLNNKINNINLNN